MPSHYRQQQNTDRHPRAEGAQVFALVEKDNLDRLISIKSAEKGGTYYHLFTGEAVYPRLGHRTCPSFVRKPDKHDNGFGPPLHEERSGGEGIAHAFTKLDIIRQKGLFVMIGRERRHLQLGNVRAEARLSPPHAMLRVDLSASIEHPSDLKKRFNGHVNIEIICTNHPGPTKLEALKSTDHGLVIISMLPWVRDQIEQQYQDFLKHDRPNERELFANWTRMVRWALSKKNIAVVRHIPGEGDPAEITIAPRISTTPSPQPARSLSELRMPRPQTADIVVPSVSASSSHPLSIPHGEEKKALSGAQTTEQTPTTYLNLATTPPPTVQASSDTEPQGALSRRSTSEGATNKATPPIVEKTTSLSSVVVERPQPDKPPSPPQAPAHDKPSQSLWRRFWNAVFGT